MTCTTQTVLALGWGLSPEIIYTRVYWLRLLFEGGVYYVQELWIVRLLLEDGDYSRAASIRRNMVSAHESEKLAVAGNRTLDSWLEQEHMMVKKRCTQLSKTGGTSCVPNKMTLSYTFAQAARSMTTRHSPDDCSVWGM